METARQKTVNRAATVQQPAASVKTVQRKAVTTKSSVQLQMSTKVSSPNDPAEKEADSTAKKIMRMAVSESSIAYMKTGSGGVFRQVKQEEKDKKLQTKLQSPYITRFADSGIFTQPKKPDEEKIQRKAEGQPNVASNVAADIQNSMATGSPLPLSVRRFMEPRFNADFSNVRVHTGDKAARLNKQLNAQAFAMGNHIFFGKDKFKPDSQESKDKELIAHELTHTIQQGGAIQRSEEVSVTQHSPIQVQRLGLSDILDGLADLAANVPGFTLVTVIIGRNPINLRVVERNFTNLLRGFMGLIPGGEILFQVLQRYGVVERIGIWVEQQMSAIGVSYDDLRRRFTTFTDSLSWSDIFSPGDVWRRAQNIFTEPITRIRNFISRLIDQAIAWLKETFMQPLSNFCREIPGYTLVTVLLGRDPFTNTPVDRSALNVVRAFAEFIPGGTEKVNQLVESRGLQRAYEWFIQETQARNLTWARVTGTFSQAWNSLRLEDVLHPIDTLQRLVTMFRPLMSDLVGFAGAALMKLLELIFEAVMGAGGARILGILKRGRDTFVTIIRNPVGFLGNLLRAVGQGVRQFMNNILQHLQQGVIAWLTGPVARAGIQMPQQWDLRGIIWFVMQILGLTWDRIRQKLVRLMGERAVATLEAGFQLIQEIRERGLVQALRDRVTEFFGQLREAALGSIKSFIQQRLVMAGIQQLVSLLSPVGAVIQAIIKTYTTIQFFIQKINQILDLVESIVNSIASIASGALGAAAAFIERTMARTIPVILDFLARFIGLGDVGSHVQNTIRGLQARVDGMLDRAVDWIVAQARRLGRLIAGGTRAVVARIREWWRVRRPFRTASGENHTLYFQGQGSRARLFMASEPKSVETVLNDETLDISNRDALRTRLTNLQSRIAREAIATYSNPQQQERAQEELQRHVEAEVLYFATQLAQHLGHVADLPPTAVTYQIGSGGRPMFVRAEPMTINPGNTTGSEARTNRDHLVGISLVSKWEQKTGEHRRGESENPTLRSRVTGTHILSAAFHGPFTQPWNVVLTDQALNNRMTRGPEAEGKKHYRTTKLSYSVRISYYTNDVPPPQAHTVKTAEVEDVKKWVGYYIGTSLHVTIKKWKNNSYSDTVWDSPVTAGLPPVQGERIPPLEEQIIEILKKRLVPNETYIKPDDPEKTVFVKTNYSGMEVTDEVRGDTGKTDMKVAEMKRQKKLYGPRGPGARIYIRKELI